MTKNNVASNKEPIMVATETLNTASKGKALAFIPLSNDQIVKFVELNIEKPSNTKRTLVKTVFAGKFYRVNFYSETQPAGCVLHHFKMISSRFIEVDQSGPTPKIIDCTIQDKSTAVNMFKYNG